MTVRTTARDGLVTTKPMLNQEDIIDPPFVAHLFGSTRWAWLWLIARVYLGYVWLTGGLDKIENAAWMNGGVLKGFWERAVVVPEPPARPLIGYDWYRSFIQGLIDTQAYTWFAQFVAYGEVVVGIALILGLFAGIAAFFGGFMNWNYMMAGTASINPLMFPLSILLIMAWKIAGYWGFDRWLLPLLGSPWQRGALFVKNEE